MEDIKRLVQAFMLRKNEIGMNNIEKSRERVKKLAH